MHSIEIHELIGQIITVLYRIGYWHRGDVATVREQLIKWFYCIYYYLFAISLLIGAVNCDDKDERIVLLEMLIAVAVASFKFSFFIWKRDQILELLNQICIFTSQNHDDIVLVNAKLQKFMKFARVFLISSFIGIFSAFAIVPFVGNEKTLFFNIEFPLDWRNNEMSFWIADAYLLTYLGFTMISLLFPVIIWYLMLSCSLRYKVLGNSFVRMGTTVNKRKISDKEKQNNFLVDLTASIDGHLRTREYIYV